MFSKCKHSNQGDKRCCAQVVAGGSSCCCMLGSWLSPDLQRYALAPGCLGLVRAKCKPSLLSEIVQNVELCHHCH